MAEYRTEVFRLRKRISWHFFPFVFPAIPGSRDCHRRPLLGNKILKASWLVSTGQAWLWPWWGRGRAAGYRFGGRLVPPRPEWQVLVVSPLDLGRTAGRVQRGGPGGDTGLTLRQGLPSPLWSQRSALITRRDLCDGSLLTCLLAASQRWAAQHLTLRRCPAGRGPAQLWGRRGYDQETRWSADGPSSLQSPTWGGGLSHP